MTSLDLALDSVKRTLTFLSILFKSLLFSSPFTMDSQSGNQNAPPYASQNRPYVPTPCPSIAMRADHAIPSNRSVPDPTTSPMRQRVLLCKFTCFPMSRPTDV
jgi:hypothetical protein